MGLRDRVLSSVKKAFDRFSGEYSAGEGEIRPDDHPTGATPGVPGDAKVTRARLKRPKDAKEELGG